MTEREREAGSAHRDVKAELDERRIARAVALGLPAVTVAAAAVAAVTVGAPMAILILTAGMLLGVIALFWASLRILSGDAALPPELEALDATAHAVDALASRKKMLVRALKDLDNERALGKLEDDDYEQLSFTYRGELKDVLTRIDASLAPHRPKAEEAVRAYLAKAEIAKDVPADADSERESGSASGSASAESHPELEGGPTLDSEPAIAVRTAAPARIPCASCATSNEPDATFCKKCGASLAKAETKTDNEVEAVDEA